MYTKTPDFCNILSLLQDSDLPSFRFATVLSDNMVLQQAPMKAIVWGFCPDGATGINVHFNGNTIPAVVDTFPAGKGAKTTWMAKLPAVAATFTPTNITATYATNTITLANVVFGDVWVCSGQSNMAYPLGQVDCWNASNVNCTVKDQQCAFGCVNNSEFEVPNMKNYDHSIRVMTITYVHLEVSFEMCPQCSSRV